MHIAYLDDSGSDPKSSIALVGSVLISPDIEFRKIGSSVGFVIQDLFAPDKQEKFEEFKACELYHGIGAFQGIDEPERFKAIRDLLTTVHNFKLPVIYSAVDKKKLSKMAVGGAHPIDVAFRMCALGIEAWMSANDEQGLGLFIMDDTSDGRLKSDLNKSFQILRSSLRPPTWTGADLWHIHDDMYFGDSRYSMGIQLSDLCSFFIARHLKYRTDVDDFYSMFADHVICSKVEPNWSQLRDALLEHDSANV